MKLRSTTPVIRKFATSSMIVATAVVMTFLVFQRRCMQIDLMIRLIRLNVNRRIPISGILVRHAGRYFAKQS